jgi:hypothetical protein
MKDVILIPAIYDGSRDLKDRTKKLSFQTNEITPKQAGELQLCVGSYVYLAIKQEPFLKEQIETLGNLKAEYEDSGKTPAQRVRNTLYRLWQQEPEGYEDFQLFYNFKMEGFIIFIKNKLL